MQSRNKILNIVLPVPLVQRVDKMARIQYKNRSEFIRESLMRNLGDIEEWQKIFAWGKKAGKKMGIKSEADADRIFFESRHGKSNGKL